MTEEKQGGTAPEPEASAPDTDQAPEQVGTAVAVADEPATAELTDPTEETPATDVASERPDATDVVAEAPPAALTEPTEPTVA